MNELTLIDPFAAGVTTGRFGDTYTDSNGNPYEHLGWDKGGPTGSPFRAPCDAVTVDFTNDGSFGPYAICLFHEFSGLYILLAHGSKSLVQLGQRVKRGEIIGLVGNLGKSSGPHLHVQVCTSKRFPRDRSVNFDPESFLEEPMTKSERGLIQIGAGDYDRMNQCYAALAAAGYLDPEGGADDLNGAVVRRFRIIELAASDNADAAYRAIGGKL